MKRLLLLALLAFSASPAMAQVGTQAIAPPAKFVPAPGMVGTFMFEDLKGVEQSIMPYVGQSVLVVNFWATWCPPCVKEMPSLDRLAALTKGTNIRVFAIAEQAEIAEVSGFFTRAKIATLTPYIDRKMQAGHAVPMRGLPTTIIIDSGGRMIGHVEGDLDWAAPDVVAWIRSIQ